MDLGLKNKVIVVTGGANDIGDEIVRVLSGEGAIVATAIAAEWDEPAAFEKSINAIAQKFGRIEGLVNNSSVNDGVGIETGNYERFTGHLHNNLAHYYLMAHYAVPYLRESMGAMVNINWKTAEAGQENTSVYAAANGGRNALTREWAVELLKYHIRVNAVVTGFYGPGNRMATPAEIAHAVAFLLSEKSSHTTGQLIHVGGGHFFN